MSSFQSHGRRDLANGLVVERLPLGFAAGRWWATFVYALPGWEGREAPVDWRTVGLLAWVDDRDGRLECVAGSGGGSEREFSQTWELIDHGAARADVRYTEAVDGVGRETLALDPTDRTGCSATRLADGSLIERLPLGRAHGRWRLRWVRSDVPAVEIEAARDDEDFDMPHERFVRLRSADGPIGDASAWGSIGGPMQPFGVEVPDSITHLEVDYLCENEPAGTEVIPLSAPS